MSPLSRLNRYQLGRCAEFLDNLRPLISLLSE